MKTNNLKLTNQINMFESHIKTYDNSHLCSKKNSNSFHSSNKPHTKKRKGSLVEIDDNFTYQTTPTTNTIKDKEHNSEEEVTEFQLEPEVKSNKENIQNFANITITDKSIKSSTGSNVSNDTMKEELYFPKQCKNSNSDFNNQYNSPSMNQISQNLNSGPSQIYSRHPSTNAIVPSNTSVNVSVFNCYDSFSEQTQSADKKSKLNLSNIRIGNGYYDKETDNTVLFTITIKVSNEDLLLKIRRNDDIFKTVRIFCEVKKLDEKYKRPLILYIIKVLNRIYGIVTLNLTRDEIKFLNGIKNTY